MAEYATKISGSKDAHNVLLENWDGSKIEFVEQFKVMLLNRPARRSPDSHRGEGGVNKVLGIFEVATGCSTGTVADPKLIFAAAIKANACGIILADNHPSGNLQPSQTDIEVTRKRRQTVGYSDPGSRYRYH